MAPKRSRTDKSEKTGKSTKKKKGGHEEDETDNEGRPYDEGGDATDEEEEDKDDIIDQAKLVYTKLVTPLWVSSFTPTTTINAKSYTNRAHRLHVGNQDAENRHFTEKASQRSTKIVPPMHSQWPVQRFLVDMRFDKFISLLVSSDICLDIMQWETDFEHNVKHELRLTDSTSPHFGKNLLWKSWSAMLQLELSYPKVMQACQSWETCFLELWKRHLDKYGSKTMLKTTIGEGGLLANLNTIIHHQWAHSGKVEANSVKTLIRTKILSQSSRESKLFSLLSQGEYDTLIKTGPLKIPNDVAAALRHQGEKVVAGFLKNPQSIHESTISLGVRALVEEIWGPELDLRVAVDLGGDGRVGLSEKARAVCVLLELMCGSRMIGILLINWFDKLRTGTMDEWEKDKLPKKFGSWTRCIKVSRLSKEGTRAARKAKLDAKGGDEPIMDRVIVKPLNTMFLDRTFLAPEMGFKEGMGDENAVDTFLYLVRILREYVFDPIRAPSKGLETNLVDGPNGQLGVSDIQAEKLPEKARNWVNGMEVDIGKYAKKKFPGMFKPKQGTHLLRKIYMIWSFNAFARKSMKETGYASEVLGHRGFKVSLNYTSLLILPSIAGDIKTNDDVEHKLKEMQTRLDAMATKLDAVAETHAGWDRIKHDNELLQGVNAEETVFFVDGKVIVMDKLHRALPGTTVEQHQFRAVRVFNSLTEKGIPPTWTNMRKMGVNNTERIRVLYSKKKKKKDMPS